MKLTQTKNVKAKSGMTLLELTVVILVLLSLISILFVGARAWKKGSDRAGCIINIRNTQQAARGFLNMKSDATAVAESDIFGGAEAFLKFQKCPSASGAASTSAHTGYTFTGTTITPGTIFLKCTTVAGTHFPEGDTTQW
jgi:prepilin-type N-terminal cleavage/methylation domain-containing protein